MTIMINSELCHKKHEPAVSNEGDGLPGLTKCCLLSVRSPAAGAVAGGEHWCEGQGTLQGWGTLTPSHSCQVCSRGGQYCYLFLQNISV